MVWTTHALMLLSLDAGEQMLSARYWTHAVFVHDGTVDRIFINGELAAEKAAPGDLNSTSHPLGIGYDPIDVANYFHGSVDEFQIYNYAMDDTEIGNLYAEQSTTIIDPNPLVLNIPFNGDLKDVSQFENHGQPADADLTYDRFGYPNNAITIDPLSGSGVTVANSAQYNSDWTTVSFWVKMNELPATGEVYLMSFGGWQERFKLAVPSHGKVVFTTYATTCCSDMDAGDGNELVVGEWTHVVAVHGTVQDKIYIKAHWQHQRCRGPLHIRVSCGIGWDPIDMEVSSMVIW